MKLSYIAQFKGFKDIEHTIYIYDRDLPDLGQPPTELLLESPGYELSYDAGISDIVQGGIIQSSVDIYIRNVGDVLDDFLNLLIASENRFLLEIDREGSSFWKGIILQDFGGVADLPEGTIQISAVDGLGLLDSIDVTNINPLATNSFLEYIIAGLNEIPTAELFSAAAVFLKARTDWWTDYMEAGKEPLSMVAVKDIGTGKGFFWQEYSTRSGYNGKEVIEIKLFSWRKVIEHIITRFNAVLMMSNGVWVIIQRDMLETDYTIWFHTFKKDFTYIGQGATEKTVKQINPAQLIYRNEGEFLNLPGLKEVKIVYLSNMVNRFGINSWIPYGFKPGDSHTSAPVYTGSGNFLHISIGALETYDLYLLFVAYPLLYQAYFRYELEVKIGSYYLQSDAKTWLITPATVPIRSFIFLQQGVGYEYKALMEWETKTNDVPVNGNVEISLSRLDFWVYTNPADIIGQSHPLAGIPLLSSSIIPAKNFMLFIYNNQEPTSDITFVAENLSGNFTLKAELEDSLFGSAGESSKGDVYVYDGAQWNPSLSQASKKWNKGYASVKNQYLNELLVNEILSNQSISLLIFSGNIHDRTVVDLINPWTTIQFSYKSAVYRLCGNNTTYNPKTESWNGDWLQIKREIIRNATPTKTFLDEQIDLIPKSNYGLDNWFAAATIWVNPRTGRVFTGDSPVITKTLSIQDSIKLGGTDILPLDYATLKKDSSDLILLQSNGYKRSMTKDINIEFGFLYNQYAVRSASNLASSDEWDVPSSEDIIALGVYLGGVGIAGGLLKAPGTAYFESPNTGATDSVGFNGRGGGHITSLGFENLKLVGAWWTSSEGIYYALQNNDSVLFISDATLEANGYSIRLMRALTIEEDELLLEDGTQMEDYIGNNGQKYTTVKIDGKVWLTEDLIETEFRDGTEIPEITEDWMSRETAARCSYDNEESNSFIPIKLSEIIIDSNSFEGRGIPQDELRIKNYSDDNIYMVLNGELVDVTAYLLKLDQTIPQTIINGIPLLDAGRVITLNQQLVDKEYVDLAVSSLRITEFFTDTISDVDGYYEMCTDLPDFATITSDLFDYDIDPIPIFKFITCINEPSLDRLLAGLYTAHVHVYREAGNKLVQIFYEFWRTDIDGVDIELLGTSSITDFFGDGAAQIINIQVALLVEVDIDITDRLAIKWFAITELGGQNMSVSMEVGENQDSNFGININPLELKSIFVPYSGAQKDVDLGSKKLTAIKLESKEVVLEAEDAPIEVLPDNYKMFVTSSGASPDKIIALKTMNENLEEIIIATLKV